MSNSLSACLFLQYVSKFFSPDVPHSKGTERRNLVVATGGHCKDVLVYGKHKNRIAHRNELNFSRKHAGP